ncbi:MAG: Zn-ribbon domain-containing OB-fold protein [Solirubrobacteraceae bacterium]
MAPSPAAVFSDHAGRGELAYQVAPDGTAVFPPRLAQPGTGAPLEWRVSAGAGTVYATTVVRRRDAEPRSLVLVDLDEGFRMMSRVEGVAPEDVAIGQRVQVRFDDGTPVFGPC